MSPDIIFDSTTGKTDALFVSNPEIVAKKDIDPEIDQALAELDALENMKKTKQPLIFLRRLMTKTQEMEKLLSGMVKPC